MQSLINQKKIEMQKMQTKLIWKKYSSAIILLGVIIIFCTLTIHRLVSLGVIKMPGSPDDRAKSVNISIDETVLAGVLYSLIIAFIICLSLYTKQIREVKEFKSENPLVNLVPIYNELEKIQSFLSETIDLDNSLIAIAIFKQIVSDNSDDQGLGIEDGERNTRLQVIQRKIDNLVCHIDAVNPEDRGDTKDQQHHEHLCSILKKVASLLSEHIEQGKEEIDDYSSSIDQISFIHIYKLLNEEDSKKDHIRILNEAYKYVKSCNDIINKKSTEKHKTNDTVFFKITKKDDVYIPFKELSETMILSRDSTERNVISHFADVKRNLIMRKDKHGNYNDFISFFKEHVLQDNDYDNLTNTLKNRLKSFNRNICIDRWYVSVKFQNSVQVVMPHVVTKILDRNENKITIKSTYTQIKQHNTSVYDAKKSELETKRLIEDNRKCLIIGIAEEFLDYEIELGTVHDSTLDLSKESMLYRILKDELFKQLKYRFENMAREEEHDASEEQIAQTSTSFQSTDDNGALKDISSTTSLEDTQILQKGTQPKK